MILQPNGTRVRDPDFQSSMSNIATLGIGCAAPLGAAGPGTHWKSVDSTPISLPPTSPLSHLPHPPSLSHQISTLAETPFKIEKGFSDEDGVYKGEGK